MKKIAKQIKGSRDILQDINTLIKDNSQLNKKLEKLYKGHLQIQKKYLHSKSFRISDMEVIAEEIKIQSADALKDLCFQLRNEIPDLFLVLGAELNGKANLAIMISDRLVRDRNLNASDIIKEIANEIKGGGGGQPFFATAGGTYPGGIQKAIEKAKGMIPKWWWSTLFRYCRRWLSRWASKSH